MGDVGTCRVRPGGIASSHRFLECAPQIGDRGNRHDSDRFNGQIDSRIQFRGGRQIDDPLPQVAKQTHTRPPLERHDDQINAQLLGSQLGRGDSHVLCACDAPLRYGQFEYATGNIGVFDFQASPPCTLKFRQLVDISIDSHRQAYFAPIYGRIQINGFLCP